MRRRRQIDPLGRHSVLAIAAGRIAIGTGALLATGPALKLLGFSEADAAGRALARLAGGRDIALGLLAVAARDDLGALRVAALTAAAVDLGDAISFGIAARDPAARRAGLSGVASGGAAALAGAWAWHHL
ncbi:MAG: hypothetical protein U0R26_01930 [Solirubrobacterales bacterium]